MFMQLSDDIPIKVFFHRFGNLRKIIIQFLFRQTEKSPQIPLQQLHLHFSFRIETKFVPDTRGENRTVKLCISRPRAGDGERTRLNASHDATPSAAPYLTNKN